MSSHNTGQTAAERRKQVITDFEKALELYARNEGLYPRFEDHVANVPESERSDLLPKLLLPDYRFRWDRGECPTIAEYCRRCPGQEQLVEDELFAKQEGGVRYVLVDKVGQGGFGLVFRARDTELQREVAVKVLKQERRASTTAVKRFEAEIQTLANIEHHGVIRVYDRGHFANGQRYMVTQYVVGQSLREFINNSPGKMVKAAEAARIMSAVAKSVDSVHRHGNQALVHRDLKPENILLDNKGKPWVADFGLAATAAELREHQAIIGGTLAYMSPEQVRDLRGLQHHDVDTRSDIWMLGAILYELLTGNKPFDGNSRDEIMEAIERYEPTAPKDLNTGVPRRLDEITRRCLRKDPNERYQTAADLANFLCQWMEDAKTVPTPWDFSGFLREKRANFSDRRWLFDEVDAWPVHQNERILLITGDLGTGKSAFVAELIHRNLKGRVLAFHCCQQDTPETLRPTCFVRSLAGMFGQKLDGYLQVLSESARQALSPQNCDLDAESAFEHVVVALNHVPPPADEVRFIVIDALDEALGARSTDSTIVDLLARRVERLPKWLRVIATTRRDPRVLQRFSNARPPLSIDRESHDIVEDLRRFIRARLSEPNLQERLTAARVDPEQVTRTLIEKSQGNFLYATQALQGIERDGYRFEQMDELPPGLDGLLRNFLARDFPQDQSFEEPRAVLEVVLAAQEPPTEELLATATALDIDYKLSGVLRELAVYLPARHALDGTRYHFVHSWVAEWLADKRRAGRFYVSPQKGHGPLAEAGWKEYKQSVQAVSRYYLRHLPHHLIQVSQWDRVVAILTDLSFLEANACAGLVVDLMRNCRKAAKQLPVGHPSRDPLVCIADSLQMNSDFLLRHPACLFQCLWNSHCARKDGPLPDLLLAWRKAYESRDPLTPWVRLLTRYPENERGLIHRFYGPGVPVIHVVANASGDRFAAFAVDGCLYAWDSNGSFIIKLEGGARGFFVPLGFDESGTYLVTAADREVVVLDFSEEGGVHFIDSLPCDAAVISGVSAANGHFVRILLSDGTLLSWKGPNGGFDSGPITVGTIEAGALTESGQHWLVITDQGHVIGESEDGPLNAALPEQLGDRLRQNRQRRFFWQAHLRFLVEHVGPSLFRQLRALWQPFVSLHALSGSIALLQEMEVEGEERDQYELGRKSAVHLWRPSLGEDFRTRTWEGELCAALAFADAKHLLAVGMTNGRIRILSGDNGEQVWTQHTHEARVTAIRWAATDRLLMSSGTSGVVGGLGDDNLLIVQQAVGASRPVEEIHAARVTGAACSPDGSRFATGDRTGRVALWEGDTGILLHLQVPRCILLDRDLKETTNASQNPFEAWTGHAGPISSMAFTPDSSLLVTGSVNGEIWFWDAQDGKARANLSIESAIAVSPARCWTELSADGSVVAAMDGSGTAVVWSVIHEFREILRIKPAHAARPEALAVSGNGSFLAIAYSSCPELGHGAPLEQRKGGERNYFARVLAVQSGQNIQTFSITLPAAFSIVHITFLDVGDVVQALVFCTGDRGGLTWDVRTWNLTNGAAIFESQIPGSVARCDEAGFFFVLQMAREKLGVTTPFKRPNCQATLGGLAQSLVSPWKPAHMRTWRERREAAFSQGDANTEVTWYPTPFDGIAARPDGRVFCCTYGHEVHFLRIESQP